VNLISFSVQELLELMVFLGELLICFLNVVDFNDRSHSSKEAFELPVFGNSLINACLWIEIHERVPLVQKEQESKNSVVILR
jgi:hypothetical protein